MTTNTSELGLERLIVAAMTGVAPASGGRVAGTPATYGDWSWGGKTSCGPPILMMQTS